MSLSAGRFHHVRYPEDLRRSVRILLGVQFLGCYDYELIGRAIGWTKPVKAVLDRAPWQAPDLCCLLREYGPESLLVWRSLFARGTQVFVDQPPSATPTWRWEQLETEFIQMLHEHPGKAVLRSQVGNANRVAAMAEYIAGIYHPIIDKIEKNGLSHCAMAEFLNNVTIRCPDCRRLLSAVPCGSCCDKSWDYRLELDEKDDRPMNQPSYATKAHPGSFEKVEIMRNRVERGQAPFHRDDARLDFGYHTGHTITDTLAVNPPPDLDDGRYDD